MYSSEPLPHFVEHYLAYLREIAPANAFFDGVHTHDDLLEDFSRGAVEAHLRELGNFGRRLAAINPDSLTPVQQVERTIAESHIRGRIHELEHVRSWERNPQLYAEVIAASLAGQVLFDYAPAAERARRIFSKLRQVPRLLQSARDNVKEPPGIFVKAAVETLRGLRTFIDRDLPRGLAAVDDLSILGDLADASTEAEQAIAAYATYLETELGPKAKGTFRLGRERFETKLKFEEGIDLSAAKLLEIGLREMANVQEEFQAIARKAGGKEKKEPSDVWRAIKQNAHPKGSLADIARSQVDELQTFLKKHKLMTVPEGNGLSVAATPPFYRWTFASLWMPGPFEVRPHGAHFYLTEADSGWPAERQAEHQRDFCEPVLWSISMHEAFPGHYLHFQRLRSVDSTLRKSLLFAPASFVEGWAHYGEQLMFEQGFGKKEPGRRLGQLAEALVRLTRLVVGIRLHTEDLSVEQGVRMFREEAYLEESSARREAERGTFDPQYVVYALGRLMMLKLRADAEEQQGAEFSLKTFHDRLLAQGLAPFWAQHELMLGRRAQSLI
ncbi:MAG: DUF885 domain-containing protein [Vicinamibacterales bacterium]